MPCKHTEITWAWDILVIIGCIIVLFVLREMFSWFSYMHEVREELHHIREWMSQQKTATVAATGNSTEWSWWKRPWKATS